MMNSGLPQSDCALKTRVEAIIDRWIRPCYTAPYEHIAVSANDQGEVWLSGLVTDPMIIDEAVRLVRGVPGVRFVFNYVTFMIKPQSDCSDINLTWIQI